MKVKFLLIIVSFFVFGETYSQIVKTQVGLTRYDLQTNNSIERRVVLNKTTGEVIIAYTGSMDPDGSNGAFLNRGTGYFYYSGTGTITPVTTFPGRIEASTRTGWPNPVLLSGGKEAIFSHISTSTSNGLYMAGRTTAGTGTWLERPITTGAETWPRAANSGDSIIVISSLYPTGNNSTMFDMRGGIGKKVSYDGGLTWTPPVSGGLDSIPGINVNKYPNVSSGTETGNVLGGDEYALDVSGKEVAVLTGAYDVTLYRSSDFGNTWTMTTLIEGDNNSADTLDDDYRASGDYSVLIDENGNTHCFWALAYGTGISYQLDKAGIMYWNDITPGMKPQVINKTVYGKEIGPSPITYYPYYSVVTFKSASAPNINQAEYGAGYTMQPSTAIDAAGNIYLSFSRIRGISDTDRYLAGAMFDGNGNFFNDCYIIKSTDHGATWEGPLNVSNTDSMECVYPSIARDVDNYVHIVYQEDNSVGAGINNTNSTVGENKMIYAKVPVADIVNPADDVPPVIKAHSDYFANTGLSFFPDTLKFIKGCNFEVQSNLPYTDLRTFANTYLVSAYDDTDTGDVLVIDSTGFDINTPGTYQVKFYAKDAAGNVSQRAARYHAVNNTQAIFASFDTATFVVIVEDDNGGGAPVLTLNVDEEYIYLGNDGNNYTLPQNLATAQSSNPCAPSPSINLPDPGSVDVNKVGKYELTVEAKSGTATTTEIFTVYVGKEPDTKFSGEEIVNGYVKATGETDDIDAEFPNTKYTWTTKNSTNSLATSTTKADLDFQIITSGNRPTRNFDSLCYQVENIFTSKIPTKAKVQKICKYLKYEKGGDTGSINVLNDGSVTFVVTPNPTSGAFELVYTGINKPSKATITISDLKGSIVSTQVETLRGDGSVSMNLKNLSNGLYFINTEIDNQSYMQKVEIKK